MATHDVTFSTPTRELGKADVAFVVKRDKAKLGELRVSNGSVVWFPRDYSYGHRLHWPELSALFLEHGARSEKK